MTMDSMMIGVEWRALPIPTEASDIPWATHEGVLTIMGFPLRCFQLSNGKRVFDADDLHRMLAGDESQPKEEA